MTTWKRPRSSLTLVHSTRCAAECFQAVIEPRYSQHLCMKYLFGLLGIAVGIFLVIKTEWFIQNFGTNDWAEQHFGTSGGTRTFYKLVGIAIIFIALMGMTGLLGGFILATVGRLFGV